MARDQAYYKAEQKIEEALKNGATELDLSKMQLSELPESIGQLSQLRILNLDNNQLTALPEAIGQLFQLQILPLHNNQLATLPEAIIQLSQLQTLWLQNNQLTTLPEAITQLSQLQTLWLNHNQLTTLPEAITQLSQLQRLSLHNNQLTTLPESIGQLFQLQGLWLDENQLTTIPESIGQLSRLQILHLRSNQLITIPESIGQLSELESLMLDGNPLTSELAEAYEQGVGGVKYYLLGKMKISGSIKTMDKRKLKVFLSYASQNTSVVEELYERLVAEDWIEPWLDKKNLLFGQDWEAEITNAVETADNVIIFLSHISINKDGFVQKELRLAKKIADEKTERTNFLIPLRLDPCEVPQSFKIYHRGDYFGEEKEECYQQLLKSLELRFEDVLRKENLLNSDKKM